MLQSYWEEIHEKLKYMENAYMKWKFWRREVEIYVGGIGICKKGTGSDDKGGGK